MAAAIVCLAAAGTTAAAPAPITLRVAQQHDATGRSIVSVVISTTADGNNQQVTVFIRPGLRACHADVWRPWPRGSVQLLYGWTPYPARRWDRLVRFVAPRAGPWTVCGYVVSESATRMGLDQYVQATARARFSVSAPPRPVLGTLAWVTCPANPKQRLLSLQARGSGAGACQRASTIVEAWTGQFYGEASARDNWSFGWHRPDGSILRVNAPRLRFSLLRVPALRRTLACRETAVSARDFFPLDLECGIARFRFGDPPRR
jgi:hypothetical protein